MKLKRAKTKKKKKYEKLNETNESKLEYETVDGDCWSFERWTTVTAKTIIKIVNAEWRYGRITQCTPRTFEKKKLFKRENTILSINWFDYGRSSKVDRLWSQPSFNGPLKINGWKSIKSSIVTQSIFIAHSAENMV